MNFRPHLHTTDDNGGDSTTESPLLLGGPLQHLALMRVVLEATREVAEPLFLTADGPAIVVPVMHLAVLDAALDETRDLLLEAYKSAGCCLECHGTILAPSRSGVPRGSCHCAHNMPPRRRAHR
jgi:hypothetical protein